MPEHGNPLVAETVQDTSRIDQMGTGTATVEDVPRGYKPTEAGVIPEGWNAIQLGKIVACLSGGTPTKDAEKFWGGTIPWVSSKDMKSPRISDTIDHVTELAVGRGTRLTVSGTLLIVVRGMSLAHSLPIALTEQQVTFNQDIKAIVPTSSVSAEFLLGWFQVNANRILLLATEATHGTKRLPTPDLLQSYVALPPLREQHVIATALSDADALIESLDRLIAKKRAIKQATMQQLLTGRTRLPGFSAQWEIVAPDDVTTRITGFWGSNTPSDETPHLAKVIRAGDISPLGKLTGFAHRYFSDGEIEKARCQIGDVVITVSGNGLGKSWQEDGQPGLAASNFVRILRPRQGRILGAYLSSALKGPDALRLLAEHTATSAFPNLRPTFFTSAWLALPSLEEQDAISSVLSDMDAELEALERRRDKTRQVKQGMMQQLLTGRTRLVEPEVAA